MRRFVGFCLVSVAVVGMGTALPGCAEDNEKQAAIKGEAPPPGSPKTQAEYYQQNKGSGMTGYPGVKAPKGETKAK